MNDIVLYGDVQRKLSPAEVDGNFNTILSMILSIQSGQSSGVVGFHDVATMMGHLEYSDKTLAYVGNDSIATNIGYWVKSGDPGSGTWVPAASFVAGAGLNADGSFSPEPNSTYGKDATSLKDYISRIDAAVAARIATSIAPTDIRSYMDGNAGRPTLAQWQANQAATDVTAVFAAIAAQAQDGDTIRCPKGIYATSSGFILPDGVHVNLVGDGEAATIFKALSPMRTLLFRDGQIARLGEVTLDGFTLDCDSKAEVGLSLRSGKYQHISRIKVRNASDVGMLLGNPPPWTALYTYDEHQSVSFGGRLYYSKQSGNLGYAPVLGGNEWWDDKEAFAPLATAGFYISDFKGVRIDCGMTPGVGKCGIRQLAGAADNQFFKVNIYQNDGMFAGFYDEAGATFLDTLYFVAYPALSGCAYGYWLTPQMNGGDENGVHAHNCYWDGIGLSAGGGACVRLDRGGNSVSGSYFYNGAGPGKGNYAFEFKDQISGTTIRDNRVDHYLPYRIQGGGAIGSEFTWAGNYGGDDPSLASGRSASNVILGGQGGIPGQANLWVSGAPYTGSDFSLIRPSVLIEEKGTYSNNWSSVGTYFGVNARPGFTGDLIAAQINGAKKFRVSSQGSVITGLLTAIDDDNELIVQQRAILSANKTALHLATGTNSANSGTSKAVSIEPVYNQPGATTANYDLTINRTETAVGSGTQRFLSCQVAGSEKFGVDDQGQFYSNAANITGAVPSVFIRSFTGTPTTPQSTLQIGLWESTNGGVGSGPSLAMFSQNSAGARSFLGRVSAIWEDQTAGNEKAGLQFAVRGNSADVSAFTVGATLSSAGKFTATSFAGDGSGLTNIAAVTATKLATARKINGVDFDGSANIAVTDSTKEPTINPGTQSQYYRGDKTWQTLNQAAVAGLASSDSPTFGGLLVTGSAPVFTRAFTGTALSLQSAAQFGLNESVSGGVGGGPSMLFFSNNASLAKSYTGRISTIWENVTAGSEAAGIVFSVRANSADTTASTNAVQIKANGDTHALIGDILIDTAGKGLRIKEGANARMGVATLVGGAATVANSTITANTRIQVTIQSLGTVAVPKAIGVTARVVGTSFTITSADPTDTSTVAWELKEPA